MKKLSELWLYSLLVAVMALGFTACSDDDDDVDVKQLEGRWGLTCDEGWETYDGGKDSWKDTYDPENPTEDCQIITITKQEDGLYKMEAIGYSESRGWEDDGTIIFELKGNKMIPVSGDYEELVEGFIVKSVSSTQLIFESKANYEGNSYYNKITFKRM